MSDKTTHYLCHSPYCTLGARGEPGRFTGGITAHQAHLLSGTPIEDVTHGEGHCPNCGEQGTPVNDGGKEATDG